MYPETYNPCPSHNGLRWRKLSQEDSFRCKVCGSLVYTQPIISGVQNRNHCPYCLHSRHVDQVEAGDRLSACKAIMQPIGLTIKIGRNKYGSKRYGELMLIHRCSLCGKLSINRLAADDLAEQLLDIFYASMGLDTISRGQLELNGIHLLRQEDSRIVLEQLHGIVPC